MLIPDDRIEDFIARWERAFGERLDRGEARLIGGRVLHLYRELLSSPPAPASEATQDVAYKPYPN